MAGTYPHDYSVLPICHYIERHMDSDEMYDSIKMLDKWYADNYRNKSETAGATGGGKQYDMPFSMEELENIGMISEVPKGEY